MNPSQTLINPPETPAHPNQVLWEKGDFTVIASTMRESGEDLVRNLGVTPGQRVLDLGCGDGTTALPLAQLGAKVTGIDIARNLVEAGNRRAQAAGLSNLAFHHGNANHLEDVADGVFDLTLTVFGAMFASQPFDAAREMVRVTKRGGRIVMGNWIAGDTTFVSQLLKISAAYTPPPPEGFVSPVTWGVESHIVERFGKAGIAPEKIALKRETFHFRHADHTPAQFIHAFRHYYGPTMNAFAAAEKNGKAEDLHRELVALAESQNQSRGAGFLIPATYMQVTVSV